MEQLTDPTGVIWLLLAARNPKQKAGRLKLLMRT